MSSRDSIPSLQGRIPQSTIPAKQKPLGVCAPTYSWFERWCRNRVLHAFTCMSNGQMRLHLPEGVTHLFGTPSLKLPTANIIVHHPRFFVQACLGGHVGIGESYCAGDWDSSDLEAVFAWGIANANQSPLLEGPENQRPLLRFGMNALGVFNQIAHALRANTVNNSKRNIEAHYDLSNDFFALFLDPTMTYSSALFLEPDASLEAAQIQKYDTLCQKLRLKPGCRLLEIGTGWGGFAIYAAKTYQCNIVTITLSSQQFGFARQKVQEAGLTDQIDIQLMDYRDLDPDKHGLFDQIVSIEMIEAVGDAYYETYFRQCARMLKPDGLLALQMITCPDSRYALLKNNVDFIQKHIFPGSLIPSLARLTKATSSVTDLSLFTLTDIGLDYASTLEHWRQRFTSNLPAIEALGFDVSFIRKWLYYLLYCKAAFASRHLSAVHAVYTRPNNPNLMHQEAVC